jgi:hypothetical protein
MVLFYLLLNGPELNLIEIIWKHAKYHWRRFVTWTKETIDAELAKLLAGHGSEFEIRFARTLKRKRVNCDTTTRFLLWIILASTWSLRSWSISTAR